MKNYKKLPDETRSILWDWFASWINVGLFKKIVIRRAINEHNKTGRQIHVAEMFGRFVIFDTRERDDINRTGKVAKMNLVDLLKSSIWNSNQIKK